MKAEEALGLLVLMTFQPIEGTAMSRARKERRDQMSGARIVRRLQLVHTVERGKLPSLAVECNGHPPSFCIEILRAAANHLEAEVAKVAACGEGLALTKLAPPI